MAESKIQIANFALSKLGSRRIISLSEDTEEARVISATYDLILDEVLCEHEWSFAQKRAALAQLDTTLPMTDDGVSIVYAKPPDIIKLNYVNFEYATVKVESYGIVSNVNGLKLIYTYRNTDPTTYHPQFTTALAMRLASEIGFNLTESTSKAQALFEEYEKIRLPRAIASDSQQSTPLQPIQDEWEKSRIGGSSSGLVGRAGQQTWYPIY